tara:strand:- start:60 stop:443 length:384 start_codon:yes stop_codon:yes gene_type:complete
MIGAIVNGITNLGSTYLKNKGAEKQAIHESKMTQISGDVDWESKMAAASGDSWKDEYLIILLTSPVIAIMYGAVTNNPEIIARVEYGFTVLNNLPEWFSYLLGVGVTASFGVKGAGQFMKLKNKLGK